MRTKVYNYILTKDTCMAVSFTKNNPNLGKDGDTQYFIENKDKPSLMDTGRIMEYKKSP
ncbi:hypothetical protein GCM10011572_36250 [Pseudoduganella buxea]|uniref:Uncharacterized protein n=1 Tax=Pseudoduganella buxea TaxID=1949069 RepID=A0ABQ1KZV2_9BURK|nr:hypothetical protein GCM10011572_36250 [Pseudoduganella buxea]